VPESRDRLIETLELARLRSLKFATTAALVEDIAQLNTEIDMKKTVLQISATKAPAEPAFKLMGDQAPLPVEYSDPDPTLVTLQDQQATRRR